MLKKADDLEPEAPDETLDDTPAEPAVRRRWLRPALLAAGPLLVAVAAGVWWMTSGGSVSTDNAYVRADKIAVSAEISGKISDVIVHENEHVESGQVLFRVDPAPYRLALARAEAAVATARTSVDSLKASYRQKTSELELARSGQAFSARELARQEPLASRSVVSQAAIDQARFNAEQARVKVAIAERELEQIRAQLGGDPDVAVDAHPQVASAIAQRDGAALDLARTEVKAAFTGVAAQVPQEGRFVTPGTPAMSLVADTGLWIDANFKETEITRIRAGQPVTISVDTYPDVRFKGRVDSVAQATGAEFSVLPAQNATGNWVKVVQRIPVRIAVATEPGQPPLRSGMSSNVTVDLTAAPDTTKAPPAQVSRAP
jgi:membrane fusion protein (multidrug efflux system)